jgi:hypothetical protein
MAKLVAAVTFVILFSWGVAAQRQSISFKEYGFSMAKPEGWFEAEKRVLDESITQLELSNLGREKLKKDDDEAKLLALFTRYVPDTHRGINPKIDVRVVPTGLARPLNFEAFRAAYTAETRARAYAADRPDYTLIQEPAVVDVIGGKGIFQITRFTIRTNQRTEYTIRSRTLVIPNGTYYFLIGIVDELGGEDLSAFVDELVKSIKIGNHN